MQTDTEDDPKDRLEIAWKRGCDAKEVQTSKN